MTTVLTGRTVIIELNLDWLCKDVEIKQGGFLYISLQDFVWDESSSTVYNVLIIQGCDFSDVGLCCAALPSTVDPATLLLRNINQFNIA